MRAEVLFVDGQINLLSHDELLEVRSHLEACEPCERRNELHARIVEHLRARMRTCAQASCPSELRDRIAFSLEAPSSLEAPFPLEEPPSLA